jgi:hypothetical protein
VIERHQDHDNRTQQVNRFQTSGPRVRDIHLPE